MKTSIVKNKNKKLQPNNNKVEKRKFNPKGDKQGQTKKWDKRPNLKAIERKEAQEEKSKQIKETQTKKEEKMKAYKKQKMKKFKILSAKTKHGQPMMKGRMELLLDQIQKNIAKDD